MTQIGRLLTAMVTPFDAKGEVDYAQARKLALALIKSGSDGVVVVGTTGESPTLIREEELRLFKEIKAAVGDKGNVVAGTGSNSTAEAVETTREAEKIGVDACLLVAPYYNNPTQDGLYQHFKTIANSTKLPCIVYNVPSRTVRNVDKETIVKLSQIENIIGVKEAIGTSGVGMVEQVSYVISNSRKGFLVWSGNDADTLPILALGGYGIISVASHLVGKQIKQMINAYLEGQTDKAAALHRNMMPLFKDLFVVANPMPVKYAVNQVGFRVGKPRLPLLEPDEKTAAFIMNTVKKYKIDLPVK